MNNTNQGSKILRIVARISSLVSIAFLLAFFLGGALMVGAVMPSAEEWLGLLFFPTGVLVGLVIAWKWEAWGGAIAIGSLLLFYAWDWIVSGGPPDGPFFILAAAPGLLFLLYAWLEQREGSVPAA